LPNKLQNDQDSFELSPASSVFTQFIHNKDYSNLFRESIYMPTEMIYMSVIWIRICLLYVCLFWTWTSQTG